MTKFESIEKKLQEKIFPDLAKGRPDWDLEHTKAVVHHMKKLLDIHNGLDKLVLVAAAYAHDWGYSDLFTGKSELSLDDVREYKEKHMERGAELIKEFLESELTNQITKDQKDRIIHLVRVHDKLDELKDEDELVLMEADTLGGLDIDFVKPTFDKESNTRYIESVRSKRIPKFITPEAKDLVVELIQRRNSLYD